MTVTVSYPKVWEYEDGNQVTTSRTKVHITYTKNDDRVKLLKIQMLIGTQIVDEVIHDVSAIGPGETLAISSDFENGQQATTVQQVGEQTLTVPAGGSVVYAPNGVDAIVFALTAGCTIYVNGQQYPYSNNVVVQNGQAIEIVNPTTSDAQVQVIEIQAAPKFIATLRFIEMDENQNELYTQEAQIEDVPPLIVTTAPPPGQAADIEVVVVG